MLDISTKGLSYVAEGHDDPDVARMQTKPW